MPNSKQSKIAVSEEGLLGPDDPVPDVDISHFDRHQKTQWYAMNFVSNRVNDINEDEGYQLRKAVCFVFSFISLMMGVFLILFGIPATAIFTAFHRNWIAISFGILLSLPIFGWIRFMFLPDRYESAARKRIIRKRKDRKKPSLFDEILKESEELSKPPATRIKIVARLKKKEYRILAATWLEFCKAIEEETGLPVSQQLIKYKHVPYNVEPLLNMNIKDDCGFQGGEIFYIYNKGGLESVVEQRKYGGSVAGRNLVSAGMLFKSIPMTSSTTTTAMVKLAAAQLIEAPKYPIEVPSSESKEGKNAFLSDAVSKV